MQKIANSLKETQAIASDLAADLKEGGVVALLGEMGAGKTTFVQAVAKALGVTSIVVSPTFILVRRYETGEGRLFWHIDLYRLNDLEEIKKLGVKEIVEDPQNIVLIEWPEKFIDLLPRQRWEVRIETIQKDKRKIDIKKVK